MRLAFPFCAAPLALLIVAGCHRDDGKTKADQAWIRLAAAPGRPAAAYLTLHGGAEPTQLLAIESNVAGSSELHESMKMGPGGMTGMQRIDQIALPARGTLSFAPGGYHVMLFGVSAMVKPGDTVPLQVRLAKGAPLDVKAKVVGAGDPAPY
jgi:copper(I)-binding protein